MPKRSEALTAASSPAARSGITAITSAGNRNNVLRGFIASQQEISKKQELAEKHYNENPDCHFLTNGIIGASVETLSWYPSIDDSSTAFNYAPPIEEIEGLFNEKDTATIHELISSIKTPDLGQADYMRSLAINLFVAGEIYALHRLKGGEWVHELIPKKFVKVSAVKATNGKVIESYLDPITGETVKVGDSADLQRIWRPNPMVPTNADSPLFAVLKVLEELDWIQTLRTGLLQKRVMTSGILAITNSILGPDFNPNDQGALAAAVNATEKLIIDQMNRNIQSDSDSPALPILLFMPFEHVEKGMNLIDVAGELPEMLIKYQEAAQRRFANGVDVPAEFLLGMGGASHWSAYLIRDLLWQQHIYPLGGLIGHSLTTTFLRPALRRLVDRGEFSGDPDKVKLWFRGNQLQTHPELFNYLISAYDKGIIGKGPILAALGIPKEAAITDAELKVWMQLKLAGMGTTDEVGEGSEISIENGTVVLPNGITPSPSRQRDGGTVSGAPVADRSRAGEGGPSQR